MSTQAYPPTPPEPPSAAAARLTPREVDILKGMARDLTNQEIGRELYLSEDTVKTHARRMFRKIAVVSRAGAVAWGFRNGVLS